MTQEKEIIVSGKFRVNGLRIIYDQPVYKMPDSSQQYGLSAPVCDIWEDLVDPENVTKEIAHKLNTYDELLDALELFTVNPKDMTFNQRIEHAEKIIAKAKAKKC